MTSTASPAGASPAGFEGLTSVFLGGPFTQLLDPATGLMSARDQHLYSRLIAFFEDRGVLVHNAHRREAWGADLYSPRRATRLDYLQIRESDMFVAFPGTPPSPGTHVEIGWASALRKPMVLLLEKAVTHAFLVTGLEAQANVEIVWFSDPQDILDGLGSAVAGVLGRKGLPTVIG